MFSIEGSVLKSYVEFRTDLFPPCSENTDEWEGAVWGRSLAIYLNEKLKQSGSYKYANIEDFQGIITDENLTETEEKELKKESEEAFLFGSACRRKEGIVFSLVLISRGRWVKEEGDRMRKRYCKPFLHKDTTKSI